MAFQNTTQAALKSLELQVGQLAEELGEIKAQGWGKLPSQTLVNSRENISSITFRSGKQVEDGNPKAENPSHPRIIKTVTSSPPFPSCLASTKKDDQDKEVLDTFRKVQVNIPLLDAIRQVPKYANFLRNYAQRRERWKGMKF